MYTGGYTHARTHANINTPESFDICAAYNNIVLDVYVHIFVRVA